MANIKDFKVGQKVKLSSKIYSTITGIAEITRIDHRDFRFPIRIRHNGENYFPLLIDEVEPATDLEVVEYILDGNQVKILRHLTQTNT